MIRFQLTIERRLFGLALLMSGYTGELVLLIGPLAFKLNLSRR